MYNNKRVKIIFKCGYEKIVKADYFQTVILKVSVLKENVFSYSYTL